MSCFGAIDGHIDTVVSLRNGHEDLLLLSKTSNRLDELSRHQFSNLELISDVLSMGPIAPRPVSTATPCALDA